MTEVGCRVREEIPERHEQIDEILDLSVKEDLMYIEISERPKHSDPFNRGNWIIDVVLKTGDMGCIKLPIEMSREAVLHYCEPLKDFIKEWMIH